MMCFPNVAIQTCGWVIDIEMLVLNDNTLLGNYCVIIDVYLNFNCESLIKVLLKASCQMYFLLGIPVYFYRMFPYLFQ